MGNVMVDVNHVSIRFIQNQEKVDNLKEYFIKLVTASSSMTISGR